MRDERRRRAAPQAARALAELRDRAGHEQTVEEPAGPLEREAGALDERAQLGGAVAAVVAERAVVARVERHPGRHAHEHAAARAEVAHDLAQKGAVVGNVLEHVEQEDEIEGARRALLLEAQSCRRARADAVERRLRVEHVEAVDLAPGGEPREELAGDVAIPRTDVEHALPTRRPLRCDAAQEARPDDLQGCRETPVKSGTSRRSIESPRRVAGAPGARPPGELASTGARPAPTAADV